MQGWTNAFQMSVCIVVTSKIATFFKFLLLKVISKVDLCGSVFIKFDENHMNMSCFSSYGFSIVLSKLLFNFVFLLTGL